MRWIDGAEIVSRQELVNILRHLAPQGLPFFPALVYLIAACRGKTVEVIWHEPDAATMRSERMPCTLKSVGKEVRQWQRVQFPSGADAISRAVTRLAGLQNEIGPELSEHNTLAALCTIVFCDSENPTLSEGIVSYFSSHPLAVESLSHPGTKYPDNLEALGVLDRALMNWPEGRIRYALTAALSQASQTDINPQKCSVERISHFELPHRRVWQKAFLCAEGVCATSVMNSNPTLMFARSTWAGRTQILRFPTALVDRPAIAVKASDERILLHQAEAPMQPNQQLPRLKYAFAKDLTVGCGGWIPTGTKQIACSDNTLWFVVREPETTVLRWRCSDSAGYYRTDTHPPDPTDPRTIEHDTITYREHMALFRGDMVPAFYAQIPIKELAPFRDSIIPPPTVAFGMHCAIAVERTLLITWIALLAKHEFDSPIRELAASTFNSKRAIAISFDVGVKLHWLGADETIEVDTSTIEPAIGFTSDGLLVVAGRGCGRVYQPLWDQVQLVACFDNPEPPCSIISTGVPREFATLTASGTLTRYRVSH